MGHPDPISNFSLSDLGLKRGYFHKHLHLGALSFFHRLKKETIV